ncbi:S8 family peptidase [Yinghuangia seranimata]|uniref:S8 family peptidase n=1 Tax=Yinghuangia seranimata TaxID=408067 RepID=UPI00248A9E30|nr:S8 family peptidase [Yinghuangia seranimata]MDI2129849.1 S8 family peptidase [Yinghuangia seranimata]
MRVVGSIKRASARSAGVAAVAIGLVAAGITPALAAPAPSGGTVAAEHSATAIPGSYIVTLKSNAGFQAESAKGKDLAGKYGAKVKHTYTTALNGFSANMTAQQARRMAADPSVALVEQDQVVRADTTQPSPPSWGLDRIDQANLPLDNSYTYPNAAGGGVTVYVIDTGVRITHNDFGGRASYGYDAVDNDNVAQDGNGHGTHVAATIAGSSYGVAKAAKIVAVRVLDNGGSGTTSGVISGIDWVTANAQLPAAANMSLGGGASTSLDNAVKRSISAGVTYAVAAGNNGVNAANSSPARVTQAITVGATSNTDTKASWSNYGSVLDLFAPGVNITSAWNTSNSATNTISGTSMASPHVAGAAAVYLSTHPSASPASVSSALVAAATTGKVKSPGSGSPNRLLRVTG